MGNTFLALLGFIFALVGIQAAAPYCMPDNTTCWPPPKLWDDFKRRLTGRLTKLSSNMYPECVKQGDNAFEIADTANGICMQYHDCSKQFCNKTLDWNIPAYSVEAKTVADIKISLEFASKHNIAVTVKTSGHSYAGSSMGKGSLLIWMHEFIKYGNIKHNHSDSCGTIYPNVVKVGGGQPWDDIYKSLGGDYHIVGGGGLTVSAAGGWLMGCGLSAMSRKYGIGIDNVLNFEVVLANGSHVLADACTNKDLFWALRGGGGGTFGVVTSVHYRIFPAEPVVHANMEITDIYAQNPVTVDKWLKKWVEWSPHLDNRWGGYWTLNTYILYFVGNMSEANRTFLDKVHAWRNSLPYLHKNAVTLKVTEADSYYDSRGGVNMTTDKTGQKEFNIASRLIPRDFVINNPEKTTDTLKWLVRNGFFTFNYLLGGKVNDVSPNATAVHPAMRKAVWQIETFGEPMIQKLRDVFQDSGAGFNHASKVEPDWKNAFWGPHLNRLQAVKNKFDPLRRFNCWHCLGYSGPIASGVKPSSSTIFFAGVKTIMIMVLSAFFLTR